jgi:hypothetical protein
VYEDIEKVLKKIRRDSPIIMMGDFNAKVGKGSDGECVGSFGLGQRNDKGDRLVEFAEKNQMVICNTMFQHHPRRLYTWKSPGDQTRNQIDYILVNKRYRNAVLNCRTYPAADCNTDHILVKARLRIRLKKLCKTTENDNNRLYTSPLKNKDKAKKFRESLQNKTDKIKIGESEEEPESVENIWLLWKSAVIETAEEILKEEKREKKKKQWMTDEILDLIDLRRQVRDRGGYEYHRINREIRRKCRIAKNVWYEERCQTIEYLQEKGKIREMHHEVKQMMKQQKRKSSKIMVIEDEGEVLCRKEEVEKAWMKYVTKLYKDDTRLNRSPEINTGSGAPDITMEELELAIRTAKRNKAVGVDRIPAECMKCLSIESKKTLLGLMNKIYKTGELPEDFCVSTFIPIPKKSSARQCSDFRTISLMSHTLKLLLAIVNRRMEKKIDEQLDETQFGFTANKGTRDAIALFKMTVQRALAVNRNIYACFVDYEKAFDRVQHEKMMKALSKYSVDQEDVSLIRNLYWRQKANMKIGSNITEETCNIEIGVRQGCPLSPRCFNLYAEEIGRHRTFRDTGFKINGRKISSISYADDKVLLAETPQQLQRMVNCLVTESAKYGMRVNTTKTKVMCISKERLSRPLTICVNGTQLEEVQKYKYLGAIMTSDGRDETEIKARIGMARKAFSNLERVLKDKKMDLSLRLRLLQCYVWTVLGYASETWTIPKAAQNRINSFELWCYRRVHRIGWRDKIRNEEVLQRTGLQHGILLPKIWEGKRIFLQNKLQTDNLFRNTAYGKIPGKASRGRRRLTMLSNM